MPNEEELNEQTMTGVYGSDVYSQDEFFDVFKSVFKFGADTFNCESLAISDNEELGARATSNRIYAEAEKYKFLHFIIERNSGRFGEIVLIMSFLINKVNAVAKEKKVNNVWGKIWSKVSKIFNRKRGNVSGYSEPVDVEKQQKPEDYLPTARG